MTCGFRGCEEEPVDQFDAFCPKHWQRLPRWARQELLKQRDGVRRGNHRAVREYGMMVTAAADLIRAASANPSATEETPRPMPAPATSA